ncbi:MAG: hypothetical protein KAR01_04270 [Desulfocapsa sp.]|nr:hypothetical protein [Desulfocapsa sp.]
MKIIQRCTIYLLLILLGTGCGSMLDVRSFMHPEADFSFYQRVGVLPFANQADDALAGEKVTEHFMTEVLINGDLAVMDPGQFNAVVNQVARLPVAGKTLGLSPDQLTQISEVAGVQGIFEGIVHEYRMIQLGGEQYPVISMTVKFIDAPTGTVVWQSNITARGGPNLPIVSIGESFLLGELTQKVVREVVDDFYDKADI